MLRSVTWPLCSWLTLLTLGIILASCWRADGSVQEASKVIPRWPVVTRLYLERLCSSEPKPQDPAVSTSHELDQLVSAYAHTPALERLSAGWVGDFEFKNLGRMFNDAIHKSARAMIKTCSEDTGLLHDMRKHGNFNIPAPDQPGPCLKRLHVVVVTDMALKPRGGKGPDKWSSFRSRGITLPGRMLARGHMVSWYSEKNHVHLFANCTQPGYVLPFELEPRANATQATVAVVVRGIPWQLLACFKHHAIPVAVDTSALDEAQVALLYGNAQLLMVPNRMALLTQRRLSHERTALLYHQPPNVYGFHRADRRTPVRRVALVGFPTPAKGALTANATGAGGGNDTADAALQMMRQVALAELGKFCESEGIQVKYSDYGGHGFDQEEMRAYVLQQRYNLGEHIGYAMGYSSVDVAVLWTPCSGVDPMCHKPVNRLVSFLSLGIPTIFKGSAAYLDIAVGYGYPLVASSEASALRLLQLLVRDAGLRQAVSELGLRIARDFTTPRIGEAYERAVCQAAAGGADAAAAAAAAAGGG